MKRLFLIAIIAVSAALPARAQFFWGLQFGFYFDGINDTIGNSNDTSGDGNQIIKGGTSFNYMLQPKLGYYITPKLVTGLSLVFTSNSFAENESGKKATDIRNYIVNIFMGNGLDSNALSWKVSPYVRYDIFNICKDKLKFWVELSGYVGSQYPYDSKNKYFLKEQAKTIYGVSLHPMISFDIANKWMLFTNLELLSFSWEGSTQYKQVTLEGGQTGIDKTTINTFLFQSRPTIAIARIFSNIGIIKKF